MVGSRFVPRNAPGTWTVIKEASSKPGHWLCGHEEGGHTSYYTTEEIEPFIIPDAWDKAVSDGFFVAAEDWDRWKGLSKKCECGCSAVGSDRHSDWCPLYKI